MGNRTPRPPHRPRAKATGPFARWLDSLKSPTGTRLSYRKVAEMLECSEQAISNIRKGHYAPGRELANRIAEMSGGAVPVASWDKPKRTRSAA